jgi:hypothetical protein
MVGIYKSEYNLKIIYYEFKYGMLFFIAATTNTSINNLMLPMGSCEWGRNSFISEILK